MTYSHDEGHYTVWKFKALYTSYTFDEGHWAGKTITIGVILRPLSIETEQYICHTHVKEENGQ